MKLKEDIYVTNEKGERVRFYNQNKKQWVNQIMVSKGTPCQIVQILGKGLVRIRCKNVSGKTIEGDEHMNKIEFNDRRILV